MINRRLRNYDDMAMQMYGVGYQSKDIGYDKKIAIIDAFFLSLPYSTKLTKEECDKDISKIIIDRLEVHPNDFMVRKGGHLDKEARFRNEADLFLFQLLRGNNFEGST